MTRCQMMSRRPFCRSNTPQPPRKAAITTARLAKTVASISAGFARVPTATGVAASCATGAALTLTSSEATLDAEIARGKRIAFDARRCSRITSRTLDCHGSAHVVRRTRYLYPRYLVLRRAASMCLPGRGSALLLRRAMHRS
ncbi:hypothetical protein CUR178_01813 [Leishmania enriettii]|uniref:Uncharacterized protein n=1 Tax=Leishmania enriettii TaxID=5663 RepID=A0A836H3C6_LEIEN|nr:hypothetical protein CUR178_01813 [Leishmania enriettii]